MLITLKEVFSRDLRAAKRIIAAAEADLGLLTNGERRDLLADNTRWSLPHIELIVDAITLDR